MVVLEWNKIFTDNQIKKLNKIKNPTVTKILDLSQEFEVDITIIFNFYADRLENEELNKK